MVKIKSKFYKIFFSVLAALLALLVIACFVLWSALATYEKTRPEVVAKDVFDKYFTTKSMSALITDTGLKFTENDKVLIENAAQEAINTDSLKFFGVTSANDNEYKYAVVSNDKIIAYFTVTDSGEKEKFGMDKKKLSNVEFVFAKQPDIKVEIPQGYSLYVNDNLIPSEKITNSGIETISCTYVPEGTQGTLLDEYTVTDLYSEPVIKVVSANGNECAVHYSTEKEAYVASAENNETLMAAYSDFVIEAARQYSIFVSYDYRNAAGGLVSNVRYTNLNKYFDTNGMAYKKLQNTQVNFNLIHPTFIISDEVARDFVAYSDDVFSCNVSLVYTTKRNGKTNVENIDLIFFLHKVNGKYMIYESITNS